MLRPLALLLALGACAPFSDIGRLTDPAGAERRAAVEVAVKSNHDRVVQDILAGGGPALNAAYDAGRVPPGDRAARTLQLGGDIVLFADNPGALAIAISGFGG